MNNKQIRRTTVNKTAALMTLLCTTALLAFSSQSIAVPTLEQDIKITDEALYFDGVKKTVSQARSEAYVPGQKMNYVYGRTIVPHGDHSVKAYKNYVFTTWYRGGINDRHMVLSRFNKETGALIHVRFPHQHTGFEGRWWVGETHNYISVAISPIDETIHLLFDLHAYQQGTRTGGNGSFNKDYFRYSYSVPGAATVADADFKLNKFVKDTSRHSEGNRDYNHLSMTGAENHGAFSRLSYPKYFLNDQGDLFSFFRQGSSHDGKLVFNRYIPSQKKWSSFTSINQLGAGNRGDVKNWSIYGDLKFLNGKIRLAFQRRLNQPNKFRANEGMYYAYSNDPTGLSQWKNHKGENITVPFVKPDKLSIFDPSTLIPNATARDSVSITGGFDFTITDNDDVHIKGRTSERVNGRNVQTIYSHHYQKGSEGEFETTADFPKSETIYAAGNDIYIIGLEEGVGRPYVRFAKDGDPANFVEVYRAPEGSRVFDKAIVNVHEGIAYLYLLQKGTGDNPASDKRTTYLQIINLNIQSSGLPEGYTFAANEGGTVNIEGTMDVAFGANDQFYFLNNQTDNVDCNRSVFGDPAPGVTKKCYVKSVENPTPTVTFNQGEIALEEGYEQLTLSVDVTSSANLDIDNVKLYINGELFRQENVAPYEWGHAGLPSELLGLTAGRYTFRAVATDADGNEATKFKIIQVNEANNNASNTTPAGCNSVTDVVWGSIEELTLSGANSCIRFDQALAGSTVQFWDSDTNTSCDFNGSVSSIDGSGSINITSNYKQSSDFTGTTLKLSATNRCQFIKVRAQ